MASFLVKYIQFISLAGFLVLLVFSILAFCNVEFFKIKQGKNISSGVILLIVSLVLLNNIDIRSNRRIHLLFRM
jgi:hypothetical protein